MIDRLLDFIWPRTCAVCGASVDRPARHVCSDCLNRLPFTPRDGCCRRCGRAAAGLDGEFLCEECRAFRPAFDRAASALHFDGVARDLVNAYKFKSRLWLRDDFVDWLEAVVRVRFRVEAVDVVVPMPSTLWHRFDRGYNPCDDLARALAKRLGRPCARRTIRRVGSPKRQGGLDEAARRTNVVGTFAVRRPADVAGRTVLVVDDIMTTGSTLAECAAELKRAGADRVWCATLARSLRT